MTNVPISAFRLQESYRFDPLALEDLRDLVAKGEGQTLEFKRKAANPEKIVREMIAFANSNGGILLVGIGDDRSIPGLKYPEDESHVIQKALMAVKPALEVTEKLIQLGGNRSVIQYDIAESKCKPHYLSADDDTRQYFVRVNDQSIRASREMKEIIRLKQRAANTRFNYGEHEKFLMKHLETHSNITLRDFVTASGLKKFHASNKLIRLVMANVLRITPHEKGDLFSLAFTKFS